MPSGTSESSDAFAGPASISATLEFGRKLRQPRGDRAARRPRADDDVVDRRPFGPVGCLDGHDRLPRCSFRRRPRLTPRVRAPPSRAERHALFCSALSFGFGSARRRPRPSPSTRAAGSCRSASAAACRGTRRGAASCSRSVAAAVGDDLGVVSASSLRTTTILTASPDLASGTPTAPTSRTPGWVITTSSISFG